MVHEDESESIFDDGNNSSLQYEHREQGHEHEHEREHEHEHRREHGHELEHDEMMDIPQSSRSILDQVDDFLNDHHHDDGSEQEQGAKMHAKDDLPSSHSETTWIPSNMQVDLDHLSHSLFTQHDVGDHGDDHDMNLNMDLDLDKDKAVSHSLPGSSVIRPHHIRPELVVSPMVSPMIMPAGSTSHMNTPFLGQHNQVHSSHSHSHSQGHNQSHGSSGGTADTVYSYANGRATQWKPKQHGATSQFSPLSSPALTAIDNAQRINFALPESTLNAANRKKPTRSAKRRTSANSTSSSSVSSTTTKVVKNSPHLIATSNSSKRHSKNSPITTNPSSNSWDDLIFKLPESSIEVNNGITNACDGVTPKSSSSGVLSSSPESRMTPATLMNYPKVILPSNTISTSRRDHSTSPQELAIMKNGATDYSMNNNDSNRSYNNEHSHNNNNNNHNHNNNSNNNSNNGNNSNNTAQVLRATESPVIKPRPSIPLSRNGSRVKIDELAPSSSLSTSSTMPMPIPEAQPKPLRSKRKVSISSSLNGGGSSDDGDVLKKEVHKAAEQGRRNRLNTALNDLDSLIPPRLKESITIPSKATTVELACSYIRQLLEASDSPISQD